MKTALLLLTIASTATYGSPPGSGQNLGSLPETFLNKVDKPSQMKYFTILSNTTLTIAEQKMEIHKWAEQNGVLDEVKHYDALEKKYRKKLVKFMTNVIEELPPLLENLMTVMEDQNQTSAQMLAKLQALGTASPQVYNVLNFALRQFMVQPYPTGNRHAQQHQPQRSPAPQPQPQRSHAKQLQPHRSPAPQPQPHRNPATQPQPQRSQAPQPQPQRSPSHGRVRQDQHAHRDFDRMEERYDYGPYGGFWKL